MERLGRSEEVADLLAAIVRNGILTGQSILLDGRPAPTGPRTPDRHREGGAGQCLRSPLQGDWLPSEGSRGDDE